jgi:hypothetical protein
MANYYIGTINPNNLENRGFNTNFSKISLKDSFYYANLSNKTGKNFNYIAFLPDDPSNNSLDSIGQTYIGNSTYNLSDDDVGDAIGAYKVYRVDSCVEDKCIKSRSKSVLRDAILQQKNIVDSRKTNIDKLEIRLTAIDENIDESVASRRFAENKQRKQREQQTKEQQEQLAQYEDLLNNIRLSHKSSKQLLSDKNRLIATTSSNIQTSTDKLEDLNNKINEANQEIAKNNSDFEKKNNIITTLRAMITIFFILLLVMIVYYGALYTRDSYPETYNSITNTINNSFSGLSGFSSFNANY